MYELDNEHTGFCKLVFYADLKDLIGIELDANNNEIEIKFKNNFGDKKYNSFTIEDTHTVIKVNNVISSVIINEISDVTVNNNVTVT